MFPQPIVLREQEQRTGLVAVVYSLSSMKAVPTTPVQRVALLLEGGAHSRLSSNVTGLIAVRINVIFHEIYISIFSSFPFFLVLITS